MRETVCMGRRKLDEFSKVGRGWTSGGATQHLTCAATH